MDYAEYLQSDHWQRLRIAAHKKFKKRCKICHGGRWLHVHHFRYAVRWHDTSLRDLVLLCAGCHEMVHRRGADKLSPSELVARFGKRFFNEPIPPRPRVLDAWEIARQKQKVNPSRKKQRVRGSRVYFSQHLKQNGFPALADRFAR